MSNVRISQQVVEVLVSVPVNSYPVIPPSPPPNPTPPSGGPTPPGDTGGTGCQKIVSIY